MSDAPLAEAAGLTVTAPAGALRVEGLDFRLAPGAALVLVGPVDAGSAVLRALVGIDLPDSGEARILGAAPAALRRRDAEQLLARVGWYPRTGALLANLSLRENLLLPLHFHRRRADAGAEALARAALARFGLDDVPDVRPEEVPLSIRRRVALARTTLLEPDLLLLDDPLDDLEDDTTRDVLRSLVAFMRERPRGLVIASHRPGVASTIRGLALPLPVIRS